MKSAKTRLSDNPQTLRNEIAQLERRIQRGERVQAARQSIRLRQRKIAEMAGAQFLGAPPTPQTPPKTADDSMSAIIIAAAGMTDMLRKLAVGDLQNRSEYAQPLADLAATCKIVIKAVEP